MKHKFLQLIISGLKDLFYSILDWFSLYILMSMKNRKKNRTVGKHKKEERMYDHKSN